MKTVLISLMVMFSTQVHADSMEEALNRILSVAFHTGCLRHAKHINTGISGGLKPEDFKFCEAETEKYKNELKTLNPGSKIKTSDGTEIIW